MTIPHWPDLAFILCAIGFAGWLLYLAALLIWRTLTSNRKGGDDK